MMSGPSPKTPLARCPAWCTRNHDLPTILCPARHAADDIEEVQIGTDAFVAVGLVQDGDSPVVVDLSVSDPTRAESALLTPQQARKVRDALAQALTMLEAG